MLSNKVLQHNNLVVKGSFYNSDSNMQSDEDKLRTFAVLKLERYFFITTYLIFIYNNRKQAHSLHFI